ncbi:MAG: hypothetical protein HYT80_08660 [Euryarchaeota archaeon]|nr:hypothetical protein [Euryarchaeota archaeon]
MALSAVARYDGVLGATTPGEILGPEGPRQGTLRIRVVGTPDDTSSRFEAFRLHLLVPAPMDAQMMEHRYVPVEFADEPGPIAFLAFEDEAPPVGALLVVSADVRTHWPIEPERVGPVEPIVFLEGFDVHEPLLFK